MSDNSNIRAEAMKWIDGLMDPSGLRGSWRLQVLEHRVSIAADGTRTERPVRLTRFAKGCPWALLSEAERYLLELAPYTGRIVNGIDIPGTYKPTRTRWIRDDQTNLDDQRRSTNENRHTLVQDLVESTAADGDSVESSEDCVESVTTEYHWDEPSLPDTLPASSQGVVVSLQQVARQEDGTYRYAIVTRTAKTRVGAGTVVECTDFRTVTQQDFTNLYGDPAAGFTDGSGVEVAIPVQCGAAGTSVEWRNLRQNDDCTWNVSVVTTVAVEDVEAERTSSKTTLETRDSVKTSAQISEVEHLKAYEPATGKVYEQRSERRPDGLYDNTVSVRTEDASPKHVEETRRTVRGVTRRTVNRHMAGKAAMPSGIGSVVNTKTDSGRYDQEITEVDKAATPVDAGEGCARTVFEHTTTERKIQPNMPTGHVSPASNGVRYERSSRITEEGSFDVTVEKHEELERRNAQVTVRKTLRGVQRTVVNQNVTTPLLETGLAVGETRQSEVTPGGLYRTTTTTTDVEAAGTIGTECQRTVFEHVDSKTVNQVSKPAPEASSAGGGKTHRKTARQTEEGTWDLVTVDTEETTRTGATKSWRKTLRGVQQTVVDRNATTALTGAGLQLGETRTSEMTPGGRYNNTTVTVAAESVGTTGEECDDQTSVHTDVTTANVPTKPDVMHQSASVNRAVSKSARATDEGTWDVTTRTVTYKPATKSGTAGSAGYSDTVQVGVNATDVPGGTGGVNREVSLSMSPNDHGSFSFTKHERTYNSVTSTGTAGSAGYTDTVTVGAHVTSVPGDAGGVNKEVSLSMSPNDHGSFSYTKHERVYSPVTNSATAGSAGYTDTVTVGANVTSVTGGSGGTNREVSLSMSPNDRGSFSYTKHERAYNSNVRTGSVSGAAFSEQIEAGVHYTGTPAASGGVNQDVSLSLSPNDHGSVSYTKHVRTYNTKIYRASEQDALESTVTTVTAYDSSSDVDGGGIGNSAHIQPNAYGGSTTTKVVRSPKAVDSGWKTWTSKTVTREGTFTYSEGVRVFRNQPSLPAPGKSDGEIGVHGFSVNRYGRYDGVYTYRKFVSYESHEGMSHNWGGGYVTWTGDVQDSLGRTWFATFKSYYGGGNERSEALDRAIQHPIPGIHVSGRTYITGASLSHNANATVKTAKPATT